MATTSGPLGVGGLSIVGSRPPSVTSLDGAGVAGGSSHGGMRGSMVVALDGGAGDPLVELVSQINHRRRQLVMRNSGYAGVKVDHRGGGGGGGGIGSGGIPSTLPALRTPSSQSSALSSRAGSAHSGRGGSVSSMERVASGGSATSPEESGGGRRRVEDDGWLSHSWGPPRGEEAVQGGGGGGDPARQPPGAAGRGPLTSGAVAVGVRGVFDESAIARRKAFDEQLRARAAELEKGYRRVLDKVKAMKSDSDQRHSDREVALLALAEKANEAMRKSVRRGSKADRESKDSAPPSPAVSRPESARVRSLSQSLPPGLGVSGARQKDAAVAVSQKPKAAPGPLTRPRRSPRAGGGEEEEDKGLKYRKTEAQLISAARMAEQRILQRKKREAKAAEEKRPAEEALQRMNEARAEAMREKERRRHVVYLLNRLMRESEEIRVREFMASHARPPAP